MSKPIVFYDIPGNAHPKKAWSPNTQKTRYSLNYKELPYKTVWVEYPDIAALAKKIGAQPTDVNNGKPYYSLPIIYDPNTDTVVSDSFDIAKYLDKQYPDKPRIIPEGTDALQAIFISTFMSEYFLPFFQLIISPTCVQLNPRSEEYFRRTREELFSKKLEDIVPDAKRSEVLAVVKTKLDSLDAIIRKNGDDKLFITGDYFSFADILVASFLFFFKLFVPAEEWKEVASWHNGRWEKLMKALQPYEDGRGDESEVWKPE